METIAILLIPLSFGVVLFRLLIVPMRTIYKIAIHSFCGFLCLWLLNAISRFTGILFPINAVTILISGFLGIPGISIMALLAVI